MVKRFARMSRPSSRPRTRPASPTSSSATSSSRPNTRPTSPTSRPRTATPPPSAPQSLETNLEEIVAKLNLLVLQDKEKAKEKECHLLEDITNLCNPEHSRTKVKLIEQFESWSDREISVFVLGQVRTNWRCANKIGKHHVEHDEQIQVVQEKQDDMNESLKNIEDRLDVLTESVIGLAENQNKIMYQLNIITDSMKKSKK